MPDENSDPYRGLKKDEYIQVLDTLKQLPKLLWEYLQAVPEPVPEANLARLEKQGYIRKIRNLYRLTPAGNTALARTSVSGEDTSLEAMEITFLQSLTFLPSVDKLQLLEERFLITKTGGQFILTPRGIAAKAEIAAGIDYVRRMYESRFDREEKERERIDK